MFLNSPSLTVFTHLLLEGIPGPSTFTSSSICNEQWQCIYNDDKATWGVSECY